MVNEQLDKKITDVLHDRKSFTGLQPFFCATSPCVKVNNSDRLVENIDNHLINTKQCAAIFVVIPTIDSTTSATKPYSNNTMKATSNYLKQFLTVLILSISSVSFAQVTGGRGNSEMTPKVSEPAKITSGGFVGDVNLFTGSYGASIALGSVSTPGGLSFALSLNYNSSFTVGATPPISTGIPYGEGWNLNIPTISVETEAFNNFRYQQYCQENDLLGAPLDFSDTGIDPQKEGDLYWYSPYIDIPGVANGRAIFKYIDVNDGKTAVFVLNVFENPIELRYNEDGWTVVTADGTRYRFNMSTAMQSFTAPANRRVLFYDQSNPGPNAAQTAVDTTYSGNNAQAVANVISPKSSYNIWYCDVITNRNIPGQAINFVYKKYGAFNYFQEFEQSAYAQAAVTEFANTTFATDHDFTAYTDILLQRVESYSMSSMVQQLKLNYQTNQTIVNSNAELIDFTDSGSGRLDSLYSYKSLNLQTSLSGWNRYEHVKANSTTFPQTPGATNPYIASGGYIRTTGVSGGTIPFDHSFLESPRLGTTAGDLIPGDIYEIRAKITRDDPEDLIMGNGTIDVAVVTGDLDNPDGTGTTSYSTFNSNNGIYYEIGDYAATRGIPLFSTFNMAMKWTLSYQEGIKNISNFFVMPNVPSKFGGFNVQIGPGNADVNLSAAPSVTVSGNIPNAREAYVFNTTGYNLKSAASLPGSFGIGMPWSMMAPIYKSMISVDNPLTGSAGDPNDAFKFWYNQPLNGYTNDNHPTKLDASVELDEFELLRYSKNPFMLVSVEQYQVNGEVGGPIDTGLKLIAKKTFEYKVSREDILENYAYATSATLQYKTGIKQVRILLDKVREIPVIATSDTTKYLTTFLRYSTYKSADNTYDETEPLNGYTGKLLTTFVDHLGGITQIEYYPVLDARTYYSSRYTQNQYCDAVVTTPAYGLSRAVTVHPVVKYILKNDEQDLVKAGTATSNNAHKRWMYDFDADSMVHKQTQMSITDDRFHHGRKRAFDIGFKTVAVYGPTLTEGGNDYVNKTVYEHHGYKLTSGSGSPTTEDYLFHGKLKSVRQYDDADKLFEETLIDYDYTQAFKHGYTRPNLYRENIQWDQKFDNPGGVYEYKDYYLNQTLSVTVDTNIYTGTNAYPFLDIPVFVGTGELRENPKFLDFYFYDSLASGATEYFRHSYFVKKTAETIRKYDDYLYKQAIVSGTVLPGVVSPNPNPFGTGHTNPATADPINDPGKITSINSGTPSVVIPNLIGSSPLSDDVLEAVVLTSNFNSPERTQVLLAQGNLSNAIWGEIIDNYTDFDSGDLIRLIESQAYFSDAVLEDLTQKMTTSWNDDVIRTFFLRNEYLSYPALLDFTHPGIAGIDAQVFADVLSKQPQMPQDVLERIIDFPHLDPATLALILKNQVLDEHIYDQLIADGDVRNWMLTDIIAQGISFPSEAAFAELLKRGFDESEMAQIVANPDREFESSEITELTTLYPLGSFLSALPFKGSPLAKYCNSSITTGWSYIETKTEYEYYEADYRGISNGRAYKVLMGLEDIPSRTVSLTDIFGSGGTRTISNLVLKHEPSWQLFAATTTSTHLPTAENEEQYFYLFDLKNRYDRHWYNYDVNTVNSELSSFQDAGIYGDTLFFTGRWDEGYQESYYAEQAPELPKYDGMTHSRQYNLRSTPFQKTTITKSQRDEPAMQRSEYYFYDARWTFNPDMSAIERPYQGDTCYDNVEPEPDPEGCAACMYWKYGRLEEHLDNLPNNYCLWEDPEVGYYACPYGVNMAECREGSELLECRPFLPESEEPSGMIPLGDLLGKTLQLRSTVIQLDTIAGAPSEDFTDLRFDRSNTYIADFHMAFEGLDANGFEHPYRMLYPFDTLTTNTILERNEHMQPALVENQVGIQTRYFYHYAQRYYNVNARCDNAAYGYNYISVDARNIGLPERVMIGVGRSDSLVTHFEFTDAGRVATIIQPSGHKMEYTFDGFHRLASVTENDNRLLSRNNYSQWNHDNDLTFDERTDQNYIYSVLYSNYVTGDTSKRELQKAFLDPLGRTAGVARAYKNDGEIKIYSGSVTYDNWGRPVETRKPFSETDNDPLNYRKNLSETLKSSVYHDPDPASLASRATNYGIDISDPHTVRTSTCIVNHIYASCELNLLRTELELIMKSGSTSNFRFYRSSVKDQDDKETVTYTNALGQTVATLAWSDLSEKIVTLFVYDNYGNLTKTINANKQESDYRYNILGQLIEEKSVDAGTKRYMYNKQGLISAIQDETDRAYETSSISTPRYRLFEYDEYGRPTAQKLVVASYHYNAFCYQDSMIGTPSVPVTDADGPHYLEYHFTNRMTMDWLNSYKTLQPIFENPITTDGLPPGAGTLEKSTSYGSDQNVPSKLGKITQTRSYNLSGVSVQNVEYTYDAQDRIATQLILQHPTDAGLTDSKLVKVKISYKYNYRGSVTQERLDIGNNGSVEKAYYYLYDDLNRLSEVRVANDTVGSSTATGMAAYDYDDARGTVKGVKYSAHNSYGPIQTIEYGYDDRDRLTLIEAELFHYELFYDDQEVSAFDMSGVDQSHNYNGNVNATLAQYRFSLASNAVHGFDETTVYGYRYDRLNRLVKADATVGDNTADHLANDATPTNGYRVGDERMTYDKIGNLLTLQRVNEGGTPGVTLTPDDFIYTYGGNNKLTAIDGQNGSADRAYTYDANGNLLTDDFRDISNTLYGRASYMYNLDKGTDTVSYLYDANDLRMYKKTAATAQTTEEMYIKDVLGHELLVVKWTTTGGTTTTAPEYFVYGTERIARIDGWTNQIDRSTFFLYDHLGNTRVSFTASDLSPIELEIVYAGDYFPYGKVLREFVDGDGGDRYLSTMHERDKETGLDYRGARYYDSDVARFLSVDPWADKYPEWSTYNYVMSNPIRLIDPTGKGPTDWFVNKITGTVIFIKGDDKVTQEKLDKMGSTFAPGDYERLGDDNMFGDKIEYGGYNINILDQEVYALVNYSENFMESYGYVKAERISVKEKEFESGGRMDGGENVKSLTYSIDEIGADRTYTWAKASALMIPTGVKLKTESGTYSKITTATYDMMIRAEKKLGKDPIYFAGAKMGADIGNAAKIFQAIIDAIK